MTTEKQTPAELAAEIKRLTHAYADAKLARYGNLGIPVEALGDPTIASETLDAAIDRLAALASAPQGEAAPAGWKLETGKGAVTGTPWVSVLNLETQCGMYFYEDRDRLMFSFLSALAATPAAPVAREPLTDDQMNDARLAIERAHGIGITPKGST